MSFDSSGFLPSQLFLVAARISQECASRMDLTIGLGDFHVLAHVAEQGSLSVRDIQAQIGMEKSRVSRIIARLQATGLIEKREHPTDGRLLEIMITAPGRLLIDAAAPLAAAYQTELISRLGDDAEETIAGLGRLLPSQ